MHHRCRPVSASPLAAHRRDSFLDSRDDCDYECPIRLSESPGAAHRSLWGRWLADVGMRIVADQLSGRLKQQFVVENRPGAGGIVAAKAAASAAPDGYTVLMTGNNNAISASLFKSLPYNILTDFASASTTSFFDLLIVTRTGSPLKSVEDIVKMARANPGTLNIATINPGSTQNLAAELFRNVADIKVTIVPFRTSPDMATALLRGDVDVAFEYYAAIRGQIADK